VSWSVSMVICLFVQVRIEMHLLIRFILPGWRPKMIWSARVRAFALMMNGIENANNTVPQTSGMIRSSIFDILSVCSGVGRYLAVVHHFDCTF